jgi:hypothetical protein
LIAPNNTDTDKLADFLESHRHGTIRDSGIKFRQVYTLPDELKYYSKVTSFVRNDHPHMFYNKPGATMISNHFLQYVRGLNQNYDLGNYRDV